MKQGALNLPRHLQHGLRHLHTGHGLFSEANDDKITPIIQKTLSAGRLGLVLAQHHLRSSGGAF